MGVNLYLENRHLGGQSETEMSIAAAEQMCSLA